MAEKENKKVVAVLDIDIEPMKEKLDEIENQLDRILTKLETLKEPLNETVNGITQVIAEKLSTSLAPAEHVHDIP